jgi:acetyl-CoA acetyltransferase
MVGLPTLHTEAACASGGVAILTAAQQIMGGIYEVVLVVGVEQQKTMSPAEGSDVLGAAADYQVEKQQYGEFMFPKLFARAAQIYRERYGLTDRQLATVAAKNFAHARRNPLAQMRDSKLTIEQACAESEKNPRIAPPLKISDCSQITDGAAAVVLCSERYAQMLRQKVRTIRLLGWGHGTDHLGLEQKDAPRFSVARSAADRAYRMAGLAPRDLQGAEVHDCFSISELLAYEILGIAESGQAAKLVETGATAHPAVRKELGLSDPGFSLPVNVGGGLLADGHPVGATGVRQIAEIHAQLTGRAGDRQVEGAKNYLAFNMGGSITTTVITLWGAPATS